MKAIEFIQAIESGKAQVLTLAKAKELIGKAIYWTFTPAAGNYTVVDELVIKEIMTRKDFWVNVEKREMDGYANDYERLKAIQPHRAKEAERILEIVNENGELPHVWCDPEETFDEPTFVCSDSDRQVYFIVKE